MLPSCNASAARKQSNKADAASLSAVVTRAQAQAIRKHFGESVGDEP
jgi:hypothetical protein